MSRGRLSMCQEYEGWSNYSAWCVNLWLAIDQTRREFMNSRQKRFVIGKAIEVAMILCLMSVQTLSFAQTETYRLSVGEYSVSAGFASGEDAKLLAGGFNYGLSQDLYGFLLAGISFPEEEPLLAGFGVSVLPAPIFGVGLGTLDKLAQTGLDYSSYVGFAVGFGKMVNDVTDETLMSSRSMGVYANLGVSKRVTTQTGLVFIPSVGMSYGWNWVTIESDYIPSDTERDDSWNGSIDLGIELSSEILISGGIGFSFEKTNITYSVGLSYRPQYMTDSHTEPQGTQ